MPKHVSYRKYVGPASKFDLAGSQQFNLLTSLGLREDHYLLDIGCGSLRAGRLFIPYLRAGHYFGIEPEEWAVKEGIANEVGESQVGIKQPTFRHSTDFELTAFGRRFDFMLANSIFSHAAPDQIDRCFAEASRALEPQGLFAATFVLGEESYTGTEWVYPAVVTFTLEFMQSLATKHGLACERLTWSHHNDQTWLLLTPQANAANIPAVDDLPKLALLQHNLAKTREKLAKVLDDPILRGYLKVKRIFTPKRRH